MKTLLTLLAFFNAHFLIAQIVNGYARVTAITGTNITISTTAGEIDETADTFDNNDLIIVMQMQDNVIGNTTNTSSFGILGSIASAGLYEVRRIVSQTAGPPRVLTIDAPLTNTYNIGANSSVQVITFRRLGSPNYTSTGNMSALSWNGSIGGVLAIDVPGIFTLAHNLSANGAGFRGAANDDNGLSNWTDIPNPTCQDNIFRTSYPNPQALKGEGIYRNTDPNFVAARGKILNGGGGGNSHNGGGGGGGNFSAGGLGGWGWNCNTVNRSAGGQGGISLNAHININRVFMGGGGGAGERNNGFDSYGGNGGGIIILRANVLQTTGACGTLTISANGANAAPGNGWDGCGGGGAGGSIAFIVNTWNVSPTCPIVVSGNGGNGGNVNSSMHGGGGGGGQGVIFYTSSAPSNVSNTTTAGSGGCNNNNNPCDRASDGENLGTNVFFSSSTPLPVELALFQAKAIGKRTAQVEWLVKSGFNVEKFELERSMDMQHWENIYQEQWGNEFYKYIDKDVPFNQVYYRLKTWDKDGSFKYSKPVFVRFEDTFAIGIYPNPANDKVFVELEEEIVSSYVQDIRGVRTSLLIHKVENQKYLSVEGVPNGLYMLHIQTATQSWVLKLAVQH